MTIVKKAQVSAITDIYCITNILGIQFGYQIVFVSDPSFCRPVVLLTMLSSGTLYR